MTHLLGGTLWSENMQAHCAFAAYSEIFDPLVLGKEFACDSVGVGRRPLERQGPELTVLERRVSGGLDTFQRACRGVPYWIPASDPPSLPSRDPYRSDLCRVCKSSRYCVDIVNVAQ